MLFLVVIFSACEQKKKIDPKFDDAQYERIDINFYKGKKDGKIYIRTGALEAAKDSGNKIVYFYKQVMDIDLASFQKLSNGGYYAKDKNHVYTWDIGVNGEEINILTNADPASFTTVGYRWAKDTHAVYFENKTVKGLNPAELTPVCVDLQDSSLVYIEFIRDNDQLFYHENSLPVRKIF
jgi:hypothetical protein